MLTGRTPAFYDALRIEQVTGHVARVNPDAKKAHLADGSALDYSELLIATGARANVFPIAGLDAPLTFRTWADARDIKERLGDCGRALIVGGGLLGLELAGALHKMGIERIAIAQRSGFVGGPLLDADPAHNGPLPHQGAQGRVDLGLCCHERDSPAPGSVSHKAFTGGTAAIIPRSSTVPCVATKGANAVSSIWARWGKAPCDGITVINRTSPMRCACALSRCLPLGIRVWQGSAPVRATRYRINLGAS